MQQGTQTDPTCNIQQYCVRLYSAQKKHTSKRLIRVVLFGLLIIKNSNFYPLILTLSVLKVANVKNSQKFEISFVEILKNVNGTSLTTDGHVITKFSRILFFFLPMLLR